MKYMLRTLSGIAAAVLAYKYLFPLIAEFTQCAYTSLVRLGFSVSIGLLALLPRVDWKRMVSTEYDKKRTASIKAAQEELQNEYNSHTGGLSNEHKH